LRRVGRPECLLNPQRLRSQRRGSRARHGRAGFQRGVVRCRLIECGNVDEWKPHRLERIVGVAQRRHLVRRHRAGIAGGGRGPLGDRTGTFLASFDTVIADGVALNGYVISSQTSPNAKGQIVGGQVTLAIPTASMASLLNSLPSDFTASSINFSSVNDTNSIVDLNARLTSAQAHLTALQALLAKATSLDDITTLEQQIEDVETSIDADQGQLNSLTQAVTYATVTVQLKERGAVTVAVKKVAAGPSVSSGVSKGWNNALLVVTIALEVLVTAIPVLVLLLIGWFVWRLRRRRVAPTPAEVTA
jgi:hypothetical protein